MSIQYDDFQGKSAIVTGGASGLGEACVRNLVKHGAHVVIADINEPAAIALVEELRDSGGTASAFKTDVTCADSVRSMVQFVVDTHGSLDFAVNSAGIPQVGVPLDEQDEELYDQLMGINVKGIWLSMKYEIPELLKTGGSLVNMGSVASLVGGSPGNAMYVGSKHAVLGMTKSAALDYATQGVRINAICPGAVRTPLVVTSVGDNLELLDQIGATHPMNRMAEPHEVAESVLFLLSDASSFTTGSAMLVDGGYSIS